MIRVLLVEDEEHLALGLRFNLENAGYAVTLARTGAEALQRLEGEHFDLVLLDVMLPGGMDGFEIARTIRRQDNFVPIIMLTARGEQADRVSGIDSGADDYVTKPFDLEELLARVRGHLRRRVWSRREAASESGEDEPPSVLEFGGSRIDFQSLRAVTHSGEEVQLTWKEAMMMRLFSEKEGQVIPRAEFLEKVWGEPGTLETRTVDNFVLRLRKYFEPNPKRPQHILSVRGVGYRFVR
ncbi:MAG: DNA-binding response regulator [Planctomycetota bacterium]|nr:MAG: DNA-binding response regulator [Planctomycetota bacterium]